MLLRIVFFHLPLAVRAKIEVYQIMGPIYSSAAQNFLSEVNELCARNGDRGVCGDKITCDWQMQTYGPLVAGNEIYFAS